MTSYIIAFDTASDTLAVALGRRMALDVECIGSHDSESPRAALSNLLPVVERLLQEHALEPRDCGEVVVGRGPGSFTGVRIGVATAKGLAQGLGVPLYGVSTLDAVAWRVAAHTDGLIGIVADAKRREVYPALYRVVDGGPVRIMDDRVEAPASAAAAFTELDEPLTLAGDGLAIYGDVFREALGDAVTFAPQELWTPSGEGLLSVFGAAVQTGALGDGDPATALPVYTRLSDAEETERARAGVASSATPGSGVQGPGETS